MIDNRIIGDVAAAISAISRPPFAFDRATAPSRPDKAGASALGVTSTSRISPQCGARANGGVLRELAMHDTLPATGCSHPGDTIPPILAGAQTRQSSGRNLIRGIAAANRIQIDLVRVIRLHEHKFDHIDPGPDQADLGTLRGLKRPIINQAAHVSVATCQSYSGAISTRKTYGLAHSGERAAKAANRAMRCQGGPGPTHERADGVIARMPDGPQAHSMAPLQGRAKRASIEHFNDNEKRVIRTGHLGRFATRTDTGYPRKMDAKASCGTLDRSASNILAVASRDATRHRAGGATPKREGRADAVKLRHKIDTSESPEASRRCRGSSLPAERRSARTAARSPKTTVPSSTRTRSESSQSSATTTFENSSSGPMGSSPRVSPTAPGSGAGSCAPSRRGFALFEHRPACRRAQRRQEGYSLRKEEL
jgi:2-methylcitrate dehydratase